MRSFAHNQKGFSLIEIVLATVLLGVGLTGTMMMLQNSIKATNNTDSLITGSNLANEKIESILADKKFNGYSSITAAQYPVESSLAAPFTQYTRITSVKEVSPSDLMTLQNGSGFKRIDVTVSWGSQSYQKTTASTVLTNY